MDTAEFIKRVVPQDGFIYLGFQNKQGSSNRFWHDTHGSGDAVSAAQSVIHKSTNSKIDTYFALASFKMGKVEVNGKLRPRRTQDNVKSLGALWVDIDVGPGKDYDTLQEAAAALGEFLKESQFPPPSMGVRSGGGYHLYWLFDKPLPPDQWAPLAQGLVRCAAEHGWKIDQKCTTDSARVLRPIGTHNFKYDPPRPVELAHDTGRRFTHAELVECLKGYVEAPQADTGAFVLGPGPGVEDPNADLRLRRKIDYKMANIVTQCEVFRHLAATGGKDEEYPMWKDSLHVTAFCSDGYEWAHELSKGHNDYAPGDTAYRYNESVKAKGRTGPTRCETFAKHKPELCAICPYNGKIKSPIVLGEDDDELPYGFKRQDGDIIYLTEDKEGNPETIVILRNRDIRDLHIKPDSEEGYLIYFTMHHARDRIPCELSWRALHKTDQDVIYLMAAYRVSLNKARAIHFRTLMTSWVEKLAHKRDYRGERPEPFGWFSPRNEPAAFSINGLTYYPGGQTEQTHAFDAMLERQYTPTGSIDTWRKAVAAQEADGRWPLLCLLVSSFAAPLVDLTGLRGLGLSVVSNRSGVGKSSVMRVAAAAWGRPTTTVFSLDDTPRSVAYKMGMIRNLPAYWDELRVHKDVDEFGKLLFQLNQGKERSRLTSDISMQTVRSWSTMVTVASNESIRDHMRRMAGATSAGIMRVFELHFDDMPVVRTEDSDNIYGRLLDENFGHAGVIYARWLVDNIDYARDTVRTMHATLQNALSLTTEERFWGATITTLVCGALFAQKAGLANVDPRALLAYLTDALEEHRGDAKTNTLGEAECFEQFFAVHFPGRLVTDSMPIGPGRVADVRVMNPVPREGVTYQIAVKDGMVRIKQSALYNFFWKNGISQRLTKQYMEQLGGMQQKCSLGAGTNYATAQTMTWTLDISQAGLADIMPKLTFIEDKEKVDG